MTSPGDSSVSYLCPQCQTQLTAKAADAGQRHACPKCGKLAKVPGVPGRRTDGGTGAAADASEASATPRRGIANIPLICPLCGTRMYATKEQVGQLMVCPDCLESVAVPDLSPPPRKPSAAPPQPSTTTAAAAGPPGPVAPPVAGSDKEDDDDLKLSEPVELPRHRSVSKQLAELLDEQEDASPGRRACDATASSPPSAAAKRPQPGGEFTAKCPVCDTLIYVTQEDVGQQRTCPDCFSPMVIKPARPKTTTR